MAKEGQTISDDDDFVYIPEALFKHLPPEYREAAEARKQQGVDVLRVADRDLKKLVQLVNAAPTTSSLSYIFHRLRGLNFEPTNEAWMENEMLTTAFVVTYARLFVEGNGASGVSKAHLPAHLIPVHDEIMDMRHKRYAHNGRHHSLSNSLQIDFDDDKFHVGVSMSMGMYLGGRNEWAELIEFLDRLMHERLQKVMNSLKEKTGYEWTFPSGPAPSWVGNYGD